MQPPCEMLDDPGEIYEQAFAKYSKLQEGSCDLGWDVTEAAIELFVRCRAAIQREGLFSKSDKIDDVHTNLIKFLFIDFYIAKLHTLHQSLRTRYAHLRQAMRLFQRFLGRCADMDAMDREDLIYYEKLVDGESEGSKLVHSSSISAADRRTMKISKYRREKEANQRIAHLTGIISSHKSSKNYNDNNDTIAEDRGRDLEEEQREVYLLQLHNHIRCSIDDMTTYTEEMGLLEHMTDLRELYDDGDGTAAATSNRGTEGDGGVRSDNVSFLPGLGSAPPAPGEGPPLEITRTSNVDGQLIMQREYVKASVFTPRMAGPTMTLEEFADRELADASLRDQAQQHQEQGPRRYRQLEADGEEDNAELVDAATCEDRDWDAFKEANPRGWGNKMGKRC